MKHILLSLLLTSCSFSPKVRETYTENIWLKSYDDRLVVICRREEGGVEKRESLTIPSEGRESTWPAVVGAVVGVVSKIVWK